MPKFRKKPVEIEAMQLAGARSAAEIVAWAEGHGVTIESFLDEDDCSALRIPTMEGVMTASLEDWIIRGVKGEFYPCKPDIFEATYDPS